MVAVAANDRREQNVPAVTLDSLLRSIVIQLGSTIARTFAAATAGYNSLSVRDSPESSLSCGLQVNAVNEKIRASRAHQSPPSPARLVVVQILVIYGMFLPNAKTRRPPNIKSGIPPPL